jgi:hypothetical protein
MLITRTVTKKILETIVHETFSNFGSLSSSSLLDSLKLLGFIMRQLLEFQLLKI